jgi:biopolymer transport protein ExbD
MKRRNPFSGGGDDDHGGLMITPLLDLFVALMPMLILGAVMTKINVVDVVVSKPVAQLSNEQKQDFDLTIRFDQNSISVVLNGKVSETLPLGSLSDSSWQEEYRQRLVEIKREHPSQFELKLEPADSVDLEYIIALMDLSREMKSTDQEIIRTDEATGQPVRVRYLFPKVILRGVYS